VFLRVASEINIRQRERKSFGRFSAVRDSRVSCGADEKQLLLGELTSSIPHPRTVEIIVVGALDLYGGDFADA
jgi:hypothetical protein